MTAYEKVMQARGKIRLTSLDYIWRIFDSFLELHGDRRFADVKAVVCGLAWLGKTPATVVGIEKGHQVKERAFRNSGSSNPEGYRKALRKMRLAEKFKRPVICFVDTPGAFCGIGAEERGQGQAIAENLMEMMALETPIISIFIGECGSGGVLALAVADEVWMLENTVYSVISPEGCASILWKDSSKAKEASECLKLTASALLPLGAIARIIPENDNTAESLKQELANALGHLHALSPEELTGKRYSRFRRLGAYK
jgi:acetyl-CoA carboxylase carboxyl transferase subunit alpha